LGPAPLKDTDPALSTSSPQAEVVSTSKPVPDLSTSSFIIELRRLVKDLPGSIPEASQFDKLAVFGADPQDVDDPTIGADELWEVGLNNILKSALGWGIWMRSSVVVNGGWMVWSILCSILLRSEV